MPITIGSQTNVPDPGSPITSPWAQDTARKIVHPFANATARDAWVGPPNGAVCITLDDGVLWERSGGVWVPAYSRRGAVPRFRAHGGASQSATHGTNTVVAWAFIDESVPAGAYTAGAFTVPTGWGGRYRFDFSVDWQSQNVGYRQAWVQASVGPRRGAQINMVPVTSQISVLAGSTEFVLSAGETVSVYGVHTAGAALLFGTDAASHFQGRYVSNV